MWIFSWGLKGKRRGPEGVHNNGSGRHNCMNCMRWYTSGQGTERKWGGKGLIFVLGKKAVAIILRP